MERLSFSVRIERRWPVAGLLVVALLWLGVAVFGSVTDPGSAPVQVIMAALPPIALGFFGTAMLPATGRVVALAAVEERVAAVQAQVTGLEAQLARAEVLLAQSADATARLAGTAAEQMPSLADAAAALDSAAARVVRAGAATQGIIDGFQAALPALEATIATVDATLRHVSSDSAVQLRIVEQMLGQVQARNKAATGEAGAAIADMTALLTRVDEASARGTEALSKRAYALDAAVDGVLDRTTAAMDAIREQLRQQLEAMQGAIDASGRRLAVLGDDGARLFGQRIEMLSRTSEGLKRQMDGHEAAVTRLQAVMAQVSEAAQMTVDDGRVTKG